MEKPLHVLVAEALGWQRVPIPVRGIDRCLSGGTHAWLTPEGHVQGCEICGDAPPHFDTDWAATGPLIERFSIGIARTVKIMDPPRRGDTWLAVLSGSRTPFADGPTPLIAVCNLILALHAAGKLPHIGASTDPADTTLTVGEPLPHPHVIHLKE